jgi:hypothetical protein
MNLREQFDKFKLDERALSDMSTYRQAMSILNQRAKAGDSQAISLKNKVLKMIGDKGISHKSVIGMMNTLPQFTLKEGGNAVEGVGPINQENVEATMAVIYKELLPALGLSKSDTASLGSTGKKGPGQQSGDIDLAVSVQALTKNNNIETPADLYTFIEQTLQKFTDRTRIMGGIGIVTCAWPISNTDGKQEGEFVQLDIMTVDSVDWARWAFFAPSFDQSPYKGLYRNEILYAIARYMDYESLETALDKEGVEVDARWKRKFYDLGKGILSGEQSRMGKKGIVKTVKTLNKEILSQNPEEAVTMFFGPDFKPNDMLTWEQAFAAIMDSDFIHADHRQEILQMTKQGILNKGYPIPPELDEVTA